MKHSLTKENQDKLMGAFPALRFFEYDHLPPALQEASYQFHDLAWDQAAKHLPRMESAGAQAGVEIAMGLRKLLEAKDCFVRARL